MNEWGNLQPGQDALLFSISGTGSAGHTKAFIYPVMDHWGGGAKSKCSGTKMSEDSNGVRINEVWLYIEIQEKLE